MMEFNYNCTILCDTTKMLNNAMLEQFKFPRKQAKILREIGEFKLFVHL